MPVTVEVSVSDSLESDDEDVPDLPTMQQWANAACECAENVIASVQIVSRDEMQGLNRDYRGKNKPTNVLSFPMQTPDEVDPGGINIGLLGDIALCAEVIRVEAHEQGKNLQSHWAHMLVHAMLHLQGYDHVTEQDAQRMENLETEILHKLGIDDPYQAIC